MSIVYAILHSLLLLIMLIVMGLLSYVGIVILRILLTKRVLCRGKKLKYKWLRFRVAVRIHRFINIIEFPKWVIIDIFRGKDKLRLFGIWCFTGYFGEGKTLGAVTFAKGLQKKYPHRNIQIYTNFNMRGQAGKITCWEDLINLPKNSIVIFDEIQSTFTSQKFKDFPLELLWKVTQCRKQGLMVLASSPVFHRMTIQLRENTDFVVVCKNVMRQDRWFSYSFYRAPDFERYQDNPIKLFTHRTMNVQFVAQDNDYRQFDTHAIVDRFDIVGNDTNEKAKVRNIVEKQTQAAITAAAAKV